MKRGNWIVKIAAFGLLAIGLIGLVTMLLWNWLVPNLFHGPELTFWQALGLLALTKILFWTFGKKHQGHGGHWRPYWKDKWNNMNPEDRERFKQKMKDKWCNWGESTPAKDSGTSID